MIVEMLDSTILAFTDSNKYTTFSGGISLVVSLAFALVQKSVKDVGMDFLRSKWENLHSWLSVAKCGNFS